MYYFDSFFLWIALRIEEGVGFLARIRSYFAFFDCSGSKNQKFPSLWLAFILRSFSRLVLVLAYTFFFEDAAFMDIIIGINFVGDLSEGRRQPWLCLVEHFHPLFLALRLFFFKIVFCIFEWDIDLALAESFLFGAICNLVNGFQKLR